MDEAVPATVDRTDEDRLQPTAKDTEPDAGETDFHLFGRAMKNNKKKFLLSRRSAP